MIDESAVVEGETNGYKTWKISGEVQGIMVQVRLNLEESAEYAKHFPIEGCRVTIARLRES